MAAGSDLSSRGCFLRRLAYASKVVTGEICGNDAIEALEPMTRVTADGETLCASKCNYTMTFRNGNLPTVNSFLSLTMYDGNTHG
jgi:hypothetical protein